MFKLFAMKNREKTPAEKKLEQIEQILFPPCSHHTDKEQRKFLVDYSADMNLDAALTDLEDGFNDEACRNTIRKVSYRIQEVRKILEAYQEINDFEYLIVDDLTEDSNEKIQAAN